MQTLMTGVPGYLFSTAFTGSAFTGTLAIAGPTQDDDGFWPACHRSDTGLHANVIHVTDLFYPVFVHKGNEDLFRFERPARECEKFDKRRARHRDSVVDDLVATFQSFFLNKFLERAQDARNTVKYLFRGHDGSPVPRGYTREMSGFYDYVYEAIL